MQPCPKKEAGISPTQPKPNKGAHKIVKNTHNNKDKDKGKKQNKVPKKFSPPVKKTKREKQKQKFNAEEELFSNGLFDDHLF